MTLVQFSCLESGAQGNECHLNIDTLQCRDPQLHAIFTAFESIWTGNNILWLREAKPWAKCTHPKAPCWDPFSRSAHSVALPAALEHPRMFHLNAAIVIVEVKGIAWRRCIHFVTSMRGDQEVVPTSRSPNYGPTIPAD